MANPSAVLTLHALGAEVGAGSGTGQDIGAASTAALVSYRCTVGTAPAITLETSPDGSSGWRTAGTLTARTTTLAEELALEGLSRYLRASWPAATAATFEATAVGHQLLARRNDLYAKLSRAVCDETEQQEPGIIARALIEATDAAVGPYGAFRDIDCMISKFGISAGPLAEVELTLDFSQVPRSIVGAVASIAALIVLQRHGFVGGGVDELVVAADTAARAWLLGAASSGSSGAAGGSRPWQWTVQLARR